MTSIDTARQELRDRQSWLANEYRLTTAALEALDVLGGSRKGRPVKTAVKRRPRGSVRDAILQMTASPIRAKAIASALEMGPDKIAPRMAELANRGTLVRVGVGLYQRADCVETAAQPEPAPVDVHELVSAQ